MKEFINRVLNGTHKRWATSLDGRRFTMDGCDITLMSSVQVHPEREYTSVTLRKFWQGPPLLTAEIPGAGSVVIAMDTTDANVTDITAPALCEIGRALSEKAGCEFYVIPDGVIISNECL